MVESDEEIKPIIQFLDCVITKLKYKITNKEVIAVIKKAAVPPYEYQIKPVIELAVKAQRL